MNGKGNTVLRGGGGLIYETVNWEAFLAFNNAFGLASVPTGSYHRCCRRHRRRHHHHRQPRHSSRHAQWDSGQFRIYGANVSTAILNCYNNPCPIMSVDRNLTTPYVWNWTLNLQHAFTPNLSMELAYVGNHGSNLTGIRDINQPPVGTDYPTTAPIAHLRPGCRPYNAKFPYLSNIFQMGNIYRSNYNGLQSR